MDGKQLSRAEALACSGCRHACHVMLYSPTSTCLFGRIPIRYIILMQIRFDGLLGFPGGLVDPSRETLEAGLGRELMEEMGVHLSVSAEDHVSSCYADPPPNSSSSPLPQLITHFYVKKLEEKQIKEVERAAASNAADHGLEVLGMARVPLYTLKRGGGLSCFLSHSFVGNARSQLLTWMLRLRMVTPQELQRALTVAAETQQHGSEKLRTDLSLAMC